MDAGMGEVRELGARVVSPNVNVLHIGDGDASLLSYLVASSKVVRRLFNIFTCCGQVWSKH